MYYDYGWRPYVTVAERRRKAAREMEKLKKKGHPVSPGRHRRPHHRQDVLGQGLVREPGALQRLREPAAARPHLRAQRLGGGSPDWRRRGQSAGQRLGDLQGGGEGDAGLEAAMAVPLLGLRRAPLTRWWNFCRDASPRASWSACAGRARACSRPRMRSTSPASCPDWAYMCKHVAAVLYGIGARLDAEPELLFRLRGVDGGELLARAASGLAVAAPAPAPDRALEEDDLAALFGLDLGAAGEAPAPRKPRRAPVPEPPPPAAKRGRPAKVQSTVPASSKARKAPVPEPLPQPSSAGALPRSSPRRPCRTRPGQRPKRNRNPRPG